MNHARLLYSVLAVAALIGALLASSAAARNIYVTNYNSDTVSVVDGNTNQVIGAPIATGSESGPYTVAITPDGKTAYVVNYDSASVSAIDISLNQVIGSPIPIPKESYGIAITPDGSRAYVATNNAGSVTAIDLAAKAVIGSPIPVCPNPSSVTITPDGAHVYVACEKDVRVVDVATNQVVGSPIPVESPYGAAVTPDGKTLFVADTEGFVVPVDTATNQAGAPIVVGESPQSVAITPDGKRAYVPDYTGKKIFVLDTATRQVIGSPIATSGEPEYMVVSPDGRRAFANMFNAGAITGVDTTTNQLVGPPIPTGEGVGGLAYVPDQSPVASFPAPTARARPGVPVNLSGAASTDPDGTVATYAWNFGDGTGASGPAPTTTHTYAKPGTYPASLTLTDNEGCSVPLVFTGETALCHGSPGATQAQAVKVAYPGVKVKCPKSAKPGGCKFKLKAVLKTGKGKKQKLKAQSSVAKAKVKAGKTAVVSLKPTKKYAAKLAGAKKTLVQQVVTISGKSTTKVGKLKIVQ